MNSDDRHSGIYNHNLRLLNKDSLNYHSLGATFWWSCTLTPNATAEEGIHSPRQLLIQFYRHFDSSVLVSLMTTYLYLQADS